MPGIERWRTGPLYTIGEASRLAEVSSHTVKRWIAGYDSGGKLMPPVFGDPIASPLVSFLELAEIVTASKFRRKKVPLERVRSAHKIARRQMGIEYPFASLRLEAFVHHIVVVPDENNPWSSLVVLDSPGLWTLPGVVSELLHQGFDYQDDLASRWFPLGRGVPIVVDPRYAAGVPTIPNRGVTVATINDRFKLGQSIQFIAKDLVLRRDQVEAAIRYADKIAA